MSVCEDADTGMCAGENASISIGYDAAHVSMSQTESDLTARTDKKIIAYKDIIVNYKRKIVPPK